MYVCHAEMNAIMNKNSASVEGCTIYVALFPCNECAKMIIQVVTVDQKALFETSTRRAICSSKISGAISDWWPITIIHITIFSILHRQAGIKEVIYYSDKHAEKNSTIASKRLLDMAGVPYKQFVPKMKKIVIDFDSANQWWYNKRDIPKIGGCIFPLMIKDN